jgi:hypothetical protein
VWQVSRTGLVFTTAQKSQAGRSHMPGMDGSMMYLLMLGQK